MTEKTTTQITDSIAAVENSREQKTVVQKVVDAIEHRDKETFTALMKRINTELVDIDRGIFRDDEILETEVNRFFQYMDEHEGEAYQEFYLGDVKHRVFIDGFPGNYQLTFSTRDNNIKLSPDMTAKWHRLQTMKE